ncbi:hypothetical protein McanMca71_008032, partial [Microsporum canis]
VPSRDRWGESAGLLVLKALCSITLEPDALGLGYSLYLSRPIIRSPKEGVVVLVGLG